MQWRATVAAMTTITGRPANAITQTESNIIAALEKHGSRITWPRRELAALLARRTDSFSAEELVAGLSGLSRATVYRTLRLLVEVGIVCKTAMPDGSPRYSLDEAYHRHHHHLVCVACGCVAEFRHPAVEHVLRAMKNHVAGELIGHRLELYHRCPGCSRELARRGR